MSADEEIRTPTVPLLRRTSLPVGLRRHGARDEIRTHTDFRPPASETGAFTSYATRADLCERGDSNSHGLSATSTSSWRVYQFRHARIGTAPGTRTLLILRVREASPPGELRCAVARIGIEPISKAYEASFLPEVER